MNSLYIFLPVWQNDGITNGNDAQQTAVTIEAFATHTTNSEPTLLALATSNNELIFFRFAQHYEAEKVTKQWPYEEPSKKISCMTFSPCGRWLICVLLSGSLDVYPTKLAFGVEIEESKKQRPPLFSDSELTTIHCYCRDDCLAQPTCAIWYETKKKRSMLVYSNKGGDILFVDLMIRRLSVSLQAPQSIHNLDVVDDFVQNDKFLLVTGFAGSQWLVPLEQNNRSLRETLGRIVPSELRELNVRGCVSPIDSMGTKCIGLLQKDHFLFDEALLKVIEVPLSLSSKLFNGINFANPVIDIVLPENTWTVNYTDVITFCVCNQTNVAFVLNQCCSTDQNISTVSKFSSVFGVLPSGRFLGFSHIQNRSENILPGCLLITESSVFFAKPGMTPKMFLHQFFSPTPDLANVELLCKAFDLDFKKCCFESVPLLLNEGNLDCALQLCYLAKSEYIQIAEIFVRNGFSKFILPKIEHWILKQNGLSDSTKCDLSKIAFDAHLNFVENSSDFERKKSEHDFKEFLSHNLWYEPEECLQILLKKHLYVVALELVKVHSLQEIFLKELLTVDDWPLTDDFFSLITSSTNTTFLLDHRSTLCLHFITRLTKVFDQFPKIWMTKVLYLFDPARPEVRRFVEQAKDQTFSVDVENLILEVVRFYLTTLIKYLFKSNKQKNDSERLPIVKKSVAGDDKSVTNKETAFVNDIPLSCGADHCCLVAVDGLYCWGRNKNGCLGNTKISVERYSTPIRVPIAFDHRQIVQVACGAEHTMCLCQNGSVYEWGSNRYGQLGSGDKTNWPSPHLVSSLEESGTVVTKIVSGQYHCAAINADGFVYSWGWNVHGQLGHKTVEDILWPKRLEFFSDVTLVDVVCGYAHTAFLTKTGQVYVCGNSTYGQVGLGETKKRTSPVLLNFFDDSERVTMIACGFFHNIVLTNKRRLWSWGATPQSLKFKALLQKRKQQIQQQSQQENEPNKHSHLPVNEGVTAVEGKHLRPSEVEIGHLNGAEIKRLCCGYHHNCLLTADGQLYSWGKGLEFQLGHGDKKERLTPTPVSTINDKMVSFVSCGADFTITVDNNGLMNGWGKNDFTQLGFESVTETEKRKLSGKVLTIQRANKTERTIQLPQDGRIYVAKPTRIVGLRVAAKRNDIKDDFVYDKMSLFSALLEFDGFYKVEELEELCRNYCAFEVNSFLCLIRGDYVQSAIRLLDSMVMRNQLNDKDFINVLDIFSLICIKHELNIEQRSDILAAVLRKIEQIKSPFNFNSYLENHLDHWVLAIVHLITRDGSENWPFSLKIKMKAIKECGKYAQKFDEKKSIEIQQKLLVDVSSHLKNIQDQDLFRFQCGHLVTKIDQHKDIKSKFIQTDEFKTKLPRTIDCLINIINESERNFTICPMCLTTNMLKFTSSGRDIFNLL